MDSMSPTARVRKTDVLPLRLVPNEIDRQQAVLQLGTANLNTVSQDKGALKLTGRYAAVEILAALVVLLFPPDDQVSILDRDLELLPCEACYSQGDA